MDKRKLKIGFFARVDDTGLGSESEAFIKYLQPAKILEIAIGNKPQHRGKFGGIRCEGEPGKDAIQEFSKGLDIIFSIETFYNPFACSTIRQCGVKSALRVNYEYLDTLVGMNKPDLFILPLDWNAQYIPNPKIILPWPVDTERFRPREIRTAKTFVHIEGNGGYMDRNGTDIVLKAIPFVKSPARFIIWSQRKSPKITDQRILWRGSATRPEELYDEGDVLLYPRKHSGQSLVVNEAQAKGMAIMMTDMEPQNKFLPPALLIKPMKIFQTEIKRLIDCAIIDPREVAKKVDEIYGQNIWQYSKQSIQAAKQKSWTALLPEYRKMFRNLLNRKGIF